MKNQVAEVVKRRGREKFPLLKEIAETLYRYHEESLHEFRSSKFLMKILKKNNFNISHPEAGKLKTHFIAKRKISSGKKIAFIVEYDALPEVGHGCGHNLISAASVVAGIITSSIASKGEVYVIGTPAEEIGEGKISMIKAGIFDSINYAMMFHPGNRTRVRPEFTALSEADVTFYGKSAHASSYPDQGINALHGLISLFNEINAYRQHLSNDFRISGIITDGGKLPNLIPEKASGKFHLRAVTHEKLQELKIRFKIMAQASAKGTFTKVRVKFSPFELKEMKIWEDLEELFRKSLLEVDPDIDLDEKPRGRWASSDIGNLSHIIPTIQPTLKITKNPTPIHTKDFARATLTDFALNQTLIAAESLALTTLKLLEEK